MYRSLIIWYFSLFLIHQSIGQPFAKKIGVESGLPSYTVFSFYQDRHGFIWMATNDGLVKYDGYETKIYRNTEGFNAISGNYINSVSADSDGNVLVGTEEGASIISVISDSVISVLGPNFIDFKDDGEGKYWLTSPDGLFTIKKDDFGRKALSRIGQDSLFQKILTDPLGLPLIYNDQAIFRKQKQGNGLVKVPFPESKLLYSVVEYDQNKLLVTTNRNDTFYWFLLNENRFEKITLKLGTGSEVLYRPLYAFIDRDKGVWISLARNTYYFEDINKKPHHYPHDIINGWGSSVYSMFQDHTGLIWIGTADQGAVIYNPLSKHFSVTDQLVGLWKFAELNQDELWAASIHGIVLIEKGELAATFRKGLLDDASFSICALLNGKLAVGTSKNGMLIFSPDQQSVEKQILMDEHGNPLKAVLDLQTDSQGRIWMATRNGMYWIDQDLKNIHSLKTSTSNSINDLEITSNFIWAASTNGLYRIDVKTLDVKHFETENFKGLSSVHTINDRDVWAASLNRGFFLLDAQNETLHHFSEKNGLPNNSVLILYQHQNNLWLGTNKGLIKYTIADSSYTLYTQMEGLPNQDFSLNSIYKTRAGDWVFAVNKAMVKVHFDSLQANPPLPKPIISSFNLFYQPVKPTGDGLLKKPIYLADEITLKYSQNIFSFDFLAQDYLSPENLKYKFKLEGFTEFWTEVDHKNRRATFTNLSPGNYRFMVKSQDDSGRESESAIIKIVIIPPYWMRTDFITAISFLLLAFTVTIVRYLSWRKLKRKLDEFKLKEQFHVEIDRISRELHDNVGSNLSIIISNLDYLQLKDQTKNIEHISDTARNTMQQLRETIWATHQSSFSMDDFEKKLVQFIEKVSFGYKSVKINLKIKAVDLALSPSQTLNLFRIIQEGTINAAKHAESPTIDIELIHANNQLSLRIMDFGKGFDIHMQSEDHYGLINLQKRANSIHANLQIRSIIGYGTELELILKL